ARDLRRVNQVELLVGLVVDLAVREHAGTVYHAGDRTGDSPNLVQHTGDGRNVADINRAIERSSTDGGDAVEGAADLAASEHGFTQFVEPSGGRPSRLRRKRPLECHFV